MPKLSALPDITSLSGAKVVATDNSDNAGRIAVSDLLGVATIVAGANVSVDNTDPRNPVVSASGGGGGSGDMEASVYDPNEIEADVYDVDNHVDGTTNKVFTAAEKTKLSGIEASADVTDAGNIGSSIHGASGKTTPVDADTMPLIDSAASNVLKKVTWANIKATLKSYFDTVYQAASQSLSDIAGLSDPNADRILFWDDSEGAYKYLAVGSNLSISGTTLNASGGGGGGGDGDMTAAIYDPNNVASDAFDMDNMVEGTNTKIMTASERTKLSGIENNADVTDATNVAAAGAFMKSSDDLDDISEGTTNKHFTATLKTKLDGVEAGADVTDAGNVASTIHGVSGKTTPVDADELGLIDSAASNALKKLTWANVKATLKTYFDALYQPASSALTALASAFTPASSSGPAGLAFAEDTDNGSNKVTLKAPASVASDIDVTLPSTAGTLAALSAAQKWTGAQQFGRTAGTIATTSGTDFDNASGDDHSRTVAGNVTYTVSNVPSGVRFDMSLLLTYTSGTITWFSGIEWVGDTAPTLTGGKVYEIIFTTFDGGTTWHAAAGEYAA